MRDAGVNSSRSEMSQRFGYTGAGPSIRWVGLTVADAWTWSFQSADNLGALHPPTCLVPLLHFTETVLPFSLCGNASALGVLPSQVFVGGLTPAEGWTWGYQSTDNASTNSASALLHFT